MRIMVDKVPRQLTNVGSLVKEIFFNKYPDFIFNVCFAVGHFEPDSLSPGQYGDPRSPWFNVFVGYYELEVPKSTWKRPFGYTIDAENQPVVNFDDILRIGKADWNYFSNWMYGVPDGSVNPFNNLGKASTVPFPRERIGNNYWDYFEIKDVEVVSAYCSRGPEGKPLVSNCPLTPFWRPSFGLPVSSDIPEFPLSFIGVKMRGQMYLSYREDGDSYKTVIFGGTVKSDFIGGDDFLKIQMAACREVILNHYRNLGFPHP